MNLSVSLFNHSKDAVAYSHLPTTSPSIIISAYGSLESPFGASTNHEAYLGTSDADPWDHYSKGRTRGPVTAHDISPEIGHIFAAPVHETYFEQFRTCMNKLFPFIVLPLEIPTATIMKQRPFLFTCCVLTAMHRDPPLQSRVARDVMKFISEHMLLEGEKSLDFLQGLLVMLAWHRVYRQNSPQLMNMLHLAKALVVDLGLNHPVNSNVFCIKVAADATNFLHGSKAETARHTLDEQRALLGFYHINFKYMTGFRRLDPVVWTSHFENSCRSLEEADQYPSDRLAVALIRLDRLVERCSNDLKPGSLMPIATFVKFFTEEFDQFRRNLHPSIRENFVLQVEIKDAELFMFERVLSAECDIPPQKVEALHLCLQKALSIIDIFLSQSLDDLPEMPFIGWLTVARAWDVLAKLSFLSTEGWDLDYVRRSPGFAAVADRMTARLMQVQIHEERKNPGGRSIRFKFLAARGEQFKRWYENNVQQEIQQSTVPPHVPDDGFAAEEPLAPLPAADFSDILWQDFAIDWSRFDSDFDFNCP